MCPYVITGIKSPIHGLLLTGGFFSDWEGRIFCNFAVFSLVIYQMSDLLMRLCFLFVFLIAEVTVKLSLLVKSYIEKGNR